MVSLPMPVNLWLHSQHAAVGIYCIRRKIRLTESNAKFTQKMYLYSSVADPGCLSRILISTHPLDPKTATKKRGKKN
jgi:hypothetical protein